MNRLELKVKLDLLGVNPRLYSLNGELNPDAVVLYDNRQCWEVFYYDERGGRNNIHFFPNENEACEYIFQEFKSLKSLKGKW